ncbi:MAG TPA: SDR family NAD(P)-dependent oxidoreductase [bacterium]|nr:SDR family NAD(P)-dependent oxidoreductase [bacterium]
MELVRGRVAVVTGAAEGIGRELALQLAAHGCSLALADVNAAALSDTAAQAARHDVPVSTHTVDVADAARMARFAAEVQERHGKAHLLINNAGVALLGTVQMLSLENLHWLMGINFWGVVHGVRCFLPILQQQEQGHIVAMSSVFGLVAPPGQAAYSASKFAVRGFMEALRHELAGSTVGVSCVHPGGVRTRIAAKARTEAGVPEGERQRVLTRFEAMARTTPEQAARRILQGVRAGEPRILIGADARRMDLVQRLLPVRYWRVLGAAMRRRR